MKPFNLEAAKRGDPIVTRDMREAKFIVHVPEANPSFRINVLINGEIFSLSETGNYWEGTKASTNDLFMAPKKRTVWVNLYVIHCQLRYQFTTEKEANEYDRLGAERIGGKAYPIEVEE